MPDQRKFKETDVPDQQAKNTNQPNYDRTDPIHNIILAFIFDKSRCNNVEKFDFEAITEISGI